MFKMNKEQHARLHTSNSGMTLIELLVSVAIMAGVTLFIGGYVLNVLNFQNYLSPALGTQQELQFTLSDMSMNLRTMNYSSLGGYPIAAVSSSSITLFADIYSNGTYEQIRYFMTSSTLQRGIIVPTGNPLTYNQANEVVVDALHNVVSTSSIFSYYDSNYTGVEAPMTTPIDISKIKVIGFSVAVQQSNQATPLYADLKITPRNIRILF